MDHKEETAYVQGQRSVYKKLLSESLQCLGYSGERKYFNERVEAIAILRELCREFGDNDWDDNLHLADIIEKHLGKYLYG